MMTDPIADMLTRMRNALRIRRKKVRIPRSRMKLGIAEVYQFYNQYIGQFANPSFGFNYIVAPATGGGNTVVTTPTTTR